MTKYLPFLLLTLIPFAGLRAQVGLPIQKGKTAEEAGQTQVMPQPQFGYLSYNDIFEQMPEYLQAKEDFAALKVKYDAEATRSEEEFQRKFTEFLQGQKDFPPSIMQKRQAELQDLMDKSVAFRRESHRLLRDAEAELQAPVSARLNEAIQAVGTELGLMFVLNTDGNALPFVDPKRGTDISQAVLLKLGLITATNPEVPSLPPLAEPASPTDVATPTPSETQTPNPSTTPTATDTPVTPIQ